MIFDFSFILVAATLLTGLIWGVDTWLFKPKRVRAAAAPAGAGAGVGASEHVREPLLVEYARSFFPVILIVLLIRSFLFEPFRIPSDSMMPTLLRGDFIFVNKFSYGLRLPVLNSKIVPIGEPQRGDVIVFRLPREPSTNYIKRLVGLPGDHIVVRGQHLYINGERVKAELNGPYEGPGRENNVGAVLGKEHLATVDHPVLFIPDRYSRDYDEVVPQGYYFFMGDNRDNSRDSRSARRPRRRASPSAASAPAPPTPVAAARPGRTPRGTRPPSTPTMSHVAAAVSFSGSSKRLPAPPGRA